jgi:prepilin-type N-terminal cleavage/methylation domain-containing protein
MPAGRRGTARWYASGEGPVESDGHAPVAVYNPAVRARQDGLTLIETLVALALLGACILMAATVVAWSRRVEERASERILAVDLAGTLAERLRAAPYADVESGEIEVEDILTRSLPGALVSLEVDEDEHLGLKRVTIEVAWRGRRPGRVSLATAIGDLELYR